MDKSEVTFGYNSKAGRFFDSATKRFVPKAQVLQVLDQETTRLEVRLKAQARLLVARRISLPEFQLGMAQLLKESHIRTASLGAGGIKGLTKSHYGTVGASLKKQYKLLAVFGEAIAGGKLSVDQILARSKSYGISSRESFHSAEKITRKAAGMKFAKRSLDSRFQHCPECLQYSTKGQYLPVDQVVPAGTNCSCSGRCRCLLVFRAYAS